MTETERRNHSKLEKDDPGHCKKCGAELPDGTFDTVDEQGRPEIFYNGEFVGIEKCGACWLKEQMSGIRSEFDRRYDPDDLPEVLR